MLEHAIRAKKRWILESLDYVAMHRRHVVRLVKKMTWLRNGLTVIVIVPEWMDECWMLEWLSEAQWTLSPEHEGRKGDHQEGRTAWERERWR